MMKRSQIYLPVEQWRRLDALGHNTRQSVSQLIRKAIDRVYRERPAGDFDMVLNDVSGLWKRRKSLPPTGAYVRQLRRGKRLERARG